MNWNNIQIWNTSVDWLNICLTFAFFVIPPLGIAMVTILFGAGARASLKLWAKAGRGYVNDPSDAFPKLLGETTGIAATFWSNLFTGVIDQTLKLLQNMEDTTVDQPPKPAEGPPVMSIEAPPPEVLVG